ncbi:sugar ABC transporter ATP-binding protein [Consotaella aegiceratis]|uniref:sugar ABC transporter ATP-binding protein n=1 Tax=Consotaella aegiceratis TaxID=3097961 RepID=UPI002F3FD60E
MAAIETDTLLLKAQGITKGFSGVVALDGVNLEANVGEVHGIAGENGAGKSTLIKVLTGAHVPDAGTIVFNGRELAHLDPRRAMHVGIACIYQELNLIPHLTVTENIYLGREIKRVDRLGILDRQTMRNNVSSLLRDLGLNIDPDARLGSLGVGQQQMIEISRAVQADAKLIIMDEPTSSLSNKEAEELFHIIAQLKARGVAVLFISHRLDELKQNCDRVTVLRDGKSVACVDMAATSVDEIIKLMVGRDIANKYPKVKAEPKDVVLSVEGLNRKGVLHDISFSLRAGEVLGFAGLVGSGRTETARAITGADPMDSGQIKVFGQEVRIRQPRDSIEAGIAFLTENRKEQGLILIQSVEFNSTMVKMERYAKLGVLNLQTLRKITQDLATGLRLRAASIDMPVGQLSGGNQQKVVIAKWLLSKARIFIFDEPTRGIDVGAKVEVYKLINELVAGGAGVIIICSEMDEVLGMSDRIIVMHEGRITAEMTRDEATQENIMFAASDVQAAPDLQYA